MLKNIFCVGGATIDFKLKSIVALELGTSNPVTAVSSYGGVARNVAENLAHLTTGVHLQCVVGDDREGQALLSHMKNKHVNIDGCLTQHNRMTATYYAILNHENELHIALANMDIYDSMQHDVFYPAWQSWIDGSIVFIDTNLPTTSIEYAIKLSRDKNILLCIDPVSVIKAKKLPNSLANVFLIKPNLSEASAITGMAINSIQDCFTAGKILLNKGAENVVISLGKSGYVVLNNNEQQYVDSVANCPVQDVNGAGDAFVAGILYGLQQHYSLLDACQVGAAAAAFTVQTNKTVAENITLLQLERFIDLHVLKEKAYATIF